MEDQEEGAFFPENYANSPEIWATIVAEHLSKKYPNISKSQFYKDIKDAFGGKKKCGIKLRFGNREGEPCPSPVKPGKDTCNRHKDFCTRCNKRKKNCECDNPT